MGGHGLVEALEAFAVYYDGVPYNVSKGTRFHADDPIVKGRATLFGELTVSTSPGYRPTSARATETASAAPGAKRTVTKPAAKGSGNDA